MPSLGAIKEARSEIIIDCLLQIEREKRGRNLRKSKGAKEEYLRI